MITIACLGLALVDALSWPLKEYPRRNKPQVNTAHLRFQPGGGAVNVATAIAQLGLTARLFAKVGDDLSGRFLLDQLASAGVDTSPVRVDSAEPTPFTYVGIRPDGERTFIHTPGSNRTFSLDDVDQRALLECDALIMPDIFGLPRIDGRPAAQLLALARQRRLRTLVDETHGMGPSRDVFELMAREADVLAPSFEDLSILYPALEPQDMAQHLVGLGAQTVVLKLGSAGCLISDHGNIHAVPAQPTTVIDATGAGDSFNAGLIVALLEGETVEVAAEMATFVASKSLGAVGAAQGIPPYAVVRDFIRPPTNC